MPQTQVAMSWRDCDVALSTDGASWTDVTGYHNSIEQSGGELATGSAHTSDATYAVVTVGKRAPATVTFNALYVESASTPYAFAKTAYETPSELYIRWSPAGRTSGNYTFYTGMNAVATPGTPIAADFDGNSWLTSMPYPAGDAGSADPVALALTFETSVVFQDTEP